MPHTSYEEKNQHSSLLIPYKYYKSILPDHMPFITPHWHKELELNFIHHGNGTFRYNSTSISVSRGDIMICPPNTLHSIMINDSKQLIYDTLIFHPNMISGNSGDRCYKEISSLLCTNSTITAPISTSHPHYTEILSSVKTIISCAKRNDAIHDLLLKSELSRIFWILITNGDIKCPAQNNISYELLQPVLEYIQEHFRDKITIEELAEKAHLSKSYFMGIFKKTTGIGALEYINQLRIKAVCDTLSQTSNNISETAFACGFSNISNFNRQFKKYTGISPSEYKKEC